MDQYEQLAVEICEEFHVTKRENVTTLASLLRERIEGLVKAARGSLNNTSGTLRAFEDELRESISNTNYSVSRHWEEQVTEALKGWLPAAPKEG